MPLILRSCLGLWLIFLELLFVNEACTQNELCWHVAGTRMSQVVAHLSTGDCPLILGVLIHRGSVFQTHEVVGQPGRVVRLVVGATSSLRAGTVAAAAAEPPPAALVAALDAEARLCAAGPGRHENIAEVYGAVRVGGVPAGLLVERLYPLPAASARDELAIACAVARGLAHVAAASPRRCYGALTARRVLVRSGIGGAASYVLCDAGIIRAAAVGGACAGGTAGAQDVRDLATLYHELARSSGVESRDTAPAPVPREVDALLAQCLASDPGAGAVPSMTEVVDCLATAVRTRASAAAAGSVSSATAASTRATTSFSVRARSALRPPLQ